MFDVDSSRYSEKNTSILIIFHLNITLEHLPFPTKHIMPPDRKIKAALSRFETLKQLWVQTTTRKLLTEYLEEHRPPESWQIREAVAFALGSFLIKKQEGHNREPRRKQDNRLLQLAFFLDVAELGTLDFLALKLH